MSASETGVRDIDEIWLTAHTAAPFGFVKFGVPVIDDAFGGGVFCGKVTEMYGPSGCGKTQMALTLVAQELISIHFEKTGALLIYFHTSGTFPIARLCDIIEGKLHRYKTEEPADKALVRNILKNLCIGKVIEPAEIITKLNQLCVGTDECRKIRLLVIDSIASLFRPFMTLKGTGDATLGQILQTAYLLKRLAFQRDTAVLVLNEVTHGGSGTLTAIGGTYTTLKPSLGEIWTKCLNCRVWIHTTKSTMSSRRYLRVLFNSDGPPSNTIQFEITSSV
ncbi:DNA repair protein XRCC3 -like protein [Babesia sp. Xinjiang]|uniref:DNA repair protein XRCC3 -like protein n=1 Tax=Babesia sp. Xinjiang TaxID=462227 RepID=UPI000A260103|nr:DNA repair protein XRCC3 -like protein [Babesia sp. Xinjiang]ORM41382.1 DNA repair protein XRCC3 -like protein [Babesia sp. Xinjiang]